MATEMTNDAEFLILGDQEGNYYAIPRETVEEYRVPEETQAQLEDTLGEEVVGYMIDTNWYARESLANQYQAERRDVAARERMVKREAAAPDAETIDQSGASAKPGGLRGLLVGMFAVLRSVAPDAPK
jgi:hypothetical protein